MFCLSKICFIILIAYCAAILSKIQVISSIVQTYDTPTIAHGFFCDKLERSSFIKEMSILYVISCVSDINSSKLKQQMVENTILFIVDMDCEHIDLFLAKANDLNLYKAPYRWLLVTTSPQITDNLEELNILVNTNVMIVNINKEHNALIHSVYKTTAESSLITEKIGFYNFKNGYTELTKTSVTVRRKNLQNATIKSSVVVTNNDTFHHLTDRKHKRIDAITKVNLIFVLLLQEVLNVTLEYSYHESWTGPATNSTQHGGVVGDLAYKKTDISASGMFMSVERTPIIEWTVMMTPTVCRFVFRQPKLSHITNVFTLPFNGNVWMASLVLVILFAVGFSIVARWEKYTLLHPNDHSLNFVEVLFVSFGAICQQGAHVLPVGYSGRIISIMLFTSLLFLYTSYSANIVALLQTSSNSIQTLNDLLESPLELGVDDTTYFRQLFAVANDPVRKAIYETKIVPKSNFFPMEEGIRRMREDLFAFHMEVAVGYNLVSDTFLENEKCGLQEIEYLQVSYPTIGMQKNSSYKELAQAAFMRMREYGLQQRELTYFYTQKPTCVSSGSSFVGVGIGDCYPAFLLFAIGISITAMVFIAELIFKYCEGKIGKPIQFQN